MLALLALIFPQRAMAQNDSAPSTASAFPEAWSDAVHSLVSGISALTPGASVSLDVQNMSSLSAADAHSIRQSLAAELTLQGNRITPGSADVELHVTLSEGADGYVWVAEIVHDGVQDIRIVSAPVIPPAQAVPQPAPQLQRKILWQQARPILDFAQQQLTPTDSLWFVLEPDRLVLHAFSGEAETVEQAAPIVPRLTSRDPRGYLSIASRTPGQTIITADAGSLLCTGSWIARLELSCSGQPGLDWLIGATTWRFASPYNYFSGDVHFSSGLSLKRDPYFSAASMRSEISGFASARWIQASLDGPALLFEGSEIPAAKFSDWGSDIVSLAPACGQAWRVLVTGDGDWLRPDTIQIYEITDRQAAAVGQPLNFPGPILALWPSDDGNTARVVSRNLSTGMYEASTVSIVCNR